MKTNNVSPTLHRIKRHDQMYQEKHQDPYRARGKLDEPSVCTQCHAVFEQGRWRWGQAPKTAQTVICPACQRINDHYPAGQVTLEGAFLESHLEEIVSLIKHHEAREREEHPLQRVIAISDGQDKLHVETTDIHLARGIGEALHHAYQGELEYHYNSAEELLRVHWRR